MKILVWFLKLMGCEHRTLSPELTEIYKKLGKTEGVSDVEYYPSGCFTATVARDIPRDHMVYRSDITKTA